jgi:secreted PhoX family phosphatase
LGVLPQTGDGPLPPGATYFAGYSNPDALSAFANPDNLGFDQDGNLWIVTDGAQPGDNNNGCFVCPTRGAERGAVRQFMSAPIGAEVSGCEVMPDGRSLFLTVQHPGSGGTVEEPRSRWPDGAAPRGSLIAIRVIDGRKVGS